MIVRKLLIPRSFACFVPLLLVACSAEAKSPPATGAAASSAGAPNATASNGTSSNTVSSNATPSSSGAATISSSGAATPGTLVVSSSGSQASSGASAPATISSSGSHAPGVLSISSSTAAPHGANPGASAKPQPAGQTLRFRAQPGWNEQTPSSAMRKAQFELPAVDGDADPATLVVFYFQGGAGTFEQNIERWCAQMKQPDGGDARSRAKLSTEALGEFAVQRFDLTGTYTAETPPGSGNYLNKPGWRLMTLVVSSPEGPYQIRVAGPEKTLAKWLPSIETFKQQLLP